MTVLTARSVRRCGVTPATGRSLPALMTPSRARTGACGTGTVRTAGCWCSLTAARLCASSSLTAADHTARHRLRLSEAVVVHTISLPVEVRPRAPCGLQNAPGCTPSRTGGFAVVFRTAGRRVVGLAAGERGLDVGVGVGAAVDGSVATGAGWTTTTAGAVVRVGSGCWVWPTVPASRTVTATGTAAPIAPTPTFSTGSRRPHQRASVGLTVWPTARVSSTPGR